MKSIVRVAVLVVAFTAAGCVSNDEAVQVSAAAPAEAAVSLYSEMHAAIPAGKADKFFEYN